LTARHKREWRTDWSVTALLNQHFPRPAYITPEILERGRAVHELCYLSDEQQPLDLPEPLTGYLRAWGAFTTAMNPCWSHREFCFETDTFHGILDRAGVLNGRLTVVDIKCGTPPNGVTPERTGVQLALYTMGIFPQTAEKIQRLAVHIMKDGKYRVKTYDHPADFVLARTLLQEASHGNSPTPHDGHAVDLDAGRTVEEHGSDSEPADLPRGM
jgi:hypothetical protein